MATGLPRAGEVGGAFPLPQRDDAKPPGVPECQGRTGQRGRGWSRSGGRGRPRMGWEGRGSARAGHPNQAQICCLLGRIPPGLQQGGGGAWWVTEVSLCPPSPPRSA